jgi:hypothetical protein
MRQEGWFNGFVGLAQQISSASRRVYPRVRVMVVLPFFD